MKHLNYFLSLAIALLSFTWAGAETVENYLVDFNSPVTITTGFKAAPGWKHITVTSGAPAYSYNATAGVDGTGCLYASSSSTTVYDLLVTPAITGTFSISVKNYNSYSNIRVFWIEEAEDGTLSRGDAAINESPTDGEWHTYTCQGKGKRLGIRMHYVYIDNVAGESADVILEPALTITAATSSLTNGTVNCNEDNDYSFTYTITVQNTGEMDLPADYENLSVSVVEYQNTTEPVATVALGQALAIGESATIEVPVTINYATYGKRTRFDAKENISGTTKAVTPWVEPVPYLPALTVRYDGSAKDSGFAISFGRQTASTSKTITVQNSGAAPLTGTITAPEGFSVDATSLSLAAGASTTVTITMGNDTYGVKSGDLIIAGDNLDDYSIALSGTVLDPEKLFVDFEDGQIPAGFYNEGSWAVNTDSYYDGPDSKKRLQNTTASSWTKFVTPLLHFDEGEKMTVDVGRRSTSTSSDYGLKIYYSTDRTTWTLLKEIANTELLKTYNGSTSYSSTYTYDPTTFVIDGIPAGDGYIAFAAGYVYIDNIYGGKVVEVAHDLIITESSFAGKASVGKAFKATATLSNVAGKAEEAFTAKLYLGENVVATQEFEGLAAGAKATASFNYAATETFEGKIKIEFAFNDDYTIATPESDIAIGNKFYEDFEGGAIPAGWFDPDGKWTISTKVLDGNSANKAAICTSNVSSSTYEGYMLVTPKLKVTEGESFSFKVQKNGYYGNLQVLYSTDRNEWTEAKSISAVNDALSWNEWYDYSVDGVPAGEYYIAFKGYAMYIDEVYGFELVPVAHDLAFVSASMPALSSVGKAFKATATVKNLNSAAEEAFTAKLYFGDEAVAEQELENLASGATAMAEFSYIPEAAFEGKAHIAFDFDGEIIASPEFDVVITDKFYENFNDVSAIPAGWYDVDGTWTILAGEAKSPEKTDHDAVARLITPLLKAAEGESFSFQGKTSSTAWATFKVYYSTDREEWTQVESIAAPTTRDEAQTYTIEGLPAGNYYIAFDGNYMTIDEVYGFELAEVDHDVVIAAAGIPTTGKVNSQYKATASLKNLRAAAEGAYTATLYFGEDAVATFEGEGIDAEGTATAELSFIANAPGTYEAHIVVDFADDYSIETETVEVTIAEEVTEDLVQVGTPTAFCNFSNMAPINTNYNNSETEVIYPASMLDIAAGQKITAITWKGYYSAKDSHTTKVSVWIGNTTDETVPTTGTGLINTDREGLVNIYSDAYTFLKKGSQNATEDMLVINLDEPFTYDGNNLRVIVRSEKITDNYSQVYFEVDENSTAKASGHQNDTYSTFTTESTYSKTSQAMPVIYIAVASEPASYSGKVVDKEGNAVAGAIVTLKAVAAGAEGISARRLPAGSDAVQYEATTDANGEFTVNVIQTATPYEVTVEAEGYKSQTLAEPVDLSNGDVVLSENIVLEKSVPSAITEINGREVESIRYVNAAGQVSERAFDGLNIVVTRYTDGTVSTVKVVK